MLNLNTCENYFVSNIEKKKNVWSGVKDKHFTQRIKKKISWEVFILTSTKSSE